MSQNMLGMSIGVKHGSTNTCQRCGGQLTAQQGPDVENTDLKGGYTETYKCINCKHEGQYWFQYEGQRQRYDGVCADYDY